MSVNFKKIFKGTIISVAASILFVCILTIFVFFMNISDRTVSLLVFALTCLSVFLGALIVGKGIPGGGLVHGLLLSVVYVLILLALSLAITGEISFDASGLFRLLGIILSGVLGGILGINTGAYQR